MTEVASVAASAGGDPPWHSKSIPRSISVRGSSFRRAVPAGRESRLSGPERVACKPLHVFKGRVFFIDRQGMIEDVQCKGNHNGGRYGSCSVCRVVRRLVALGAIVQPFLDISVDCVILAPANAGTPSAPSTPSTGVGVGASTGFVRGISMRAKILSSNQSTAGGGTQPLSPAQFAANHHKQCILARDLDAMLTDAEEQRDLEEVHRTDGKRSRSVAGLDDETVDGGGSVPKVHRHRIRVRGIDTEYCKHGPGIPEWWHFPECDRHYYFAPIEDESSSTRAPHHDTCAAPQAGATAAATGKNPSAAPKHVDKKERQAEAGGGNKGGYCVLCKEKHNHAKKHADTKAHQQVVQQLMLKRQRAQEEVAVQVLATVQVLESDPLKQRDRPPATVDGADSATRVTTVIAAQHSPKTRGRRSAAQRLPDPGSRGATPPKKEHKLINCVAAVAEGKSHEAASIPPRTTRQSKTAQRAPLPRQVAAT